MATPPSLPFVPVADEQPIVDPPGREPDRPPTAACRRRRERVRTARERPSPRRPPACRRVRPRTTRCRSATAYRLRLPPRARAHDLRWRRDAGVDGRRCARSEAKPRPNLPAYFEQRVRKARFHLGASSMSASRVLALLATALLVVAGCTSSGAAATPIGGGPSSAAGVVLDAASSPTFGMVLTGPNGMTLYTHAGDSATSSTCTGGCATAWPPLQTTGQPTAGPGVTGQLGTLIRAGRHDPGHLWRPAALRLAGRHEAR